MTHASLGGTSGALTGSSGGPRAGRGCCGGPASAGAAGEGALLLRLLLWLRERRSGVWLGGACVRMMRG